MVTNNNIIDLNYAKDYIKLSFAEKQEIHLKFNQDEKLKLCYALKELYDIMQLRLPKEKSNNVRLVIVYGVKQNGNVIDFSDYFDLKEIFND